MDRETVLRRLRELRDFNKLQIIPAWLPINGWSGPIAELAGAALKLIESEVATLRISTDTGPIYHQLNPNGNLDWGNVEDRKITAITYLAGKWTRVG